MAASNLPPIIIKKKKRAHGEHHGGAWKVALADFMTAMFIVFLLLWLINQTTPEQRSGIADYFAPASVSRNTSGSGGMLGGQSIVQPGVQRSPSSPLGAPGGGPTSPQEGEGNTEVPGYPGTADKVTRDATRLASAVGGPGTGSAPAKDDRVFERAEQQIRQAVQTIPELAQFAQNLQIERVEEGLRIQLIDNDKRELFRSGSAQPLPHTAALMAQVAKAIQNLPNKISVTGHTDSSPFASNATYTNWELSADRANASRRLLLAAGIQDGRLSSVSGRADREPLLPNEPNAASNRRISITLLREAPPPVVTAAGSGGPRAPAGPAPQVFGPAPDGRLIPREMTPGR
jgi:chemotaxis protein MotB